MSGNKGKDCPVLDRSSCPHISALLRLLDSFWQCHISSQPLDLACSRTRFRKLCRRRLRSALCAQPVLNHADDVLVVVLRDETMDMALYQPGKPTIFHPVFFVEVKSGTAAADVLEAEPAHGVGAGRQTYRVVPVELRRAALSDHLPASRLATQIPGNCKIGPPDQPKPRRVTLVDDLDPHVSMFDYARIEQARRSWIVLRFGVKDRPDLLAGSIDLPTDVVHYHVGHLPPQNAQLIRQDCHARLFRLEHITSSM
jgi:hypothetical protein